MAQAQAQALHWGTFQLTDKGRDAPLDAALADAGIARGRFPALSAGDVLMADSF